ncbi:MULTISPECIES: hypothetical protein [Yersinia]|uniref:Uncharacterized protein n=2 Tax=Yersinia TaxID=629 RepID=B7UF80_YERPU|nr:MULTISPECIES: hypothetical protein [Yersinia]MBO1551359.1 hypothetical protein [Yersinia pseudotuberculosis]MBO1562439.1 hypothetical protein [Yersinia pseudotuberculosis]MBO1571412.1 hypothetical protein [Yersinia pseudotuberculosis]MBO1586364.1 hypothetical protein [Yersinia pseudotuberculosis]MBO1631810.1 hypothetical protein [Yersinia pseudotuberculosis]
MSITITEKDLRELYIQRAARVIQFKRACRLRAKNPEKITLNDLSALRYLIVEAEDNIVTFEKEHLR